MSRSGYTEDCEYLGIYRASVERAMKGKRGQAFFRDLITALDAMPEKRLVSGDLETHEGAVCALGALGRHRRVDMSQLDTYDHDGLGTAFGIAKVLAAETMFENDESGCKTPEERWQHIRDWADSQLRAPTEP